MDEQVKTQEEQMVPRRRLGRGLNALLGSGGADNAEAGQPAEADAPDWSLIDVGLIDRNPFQPRREFAEAALNDLAESIKNHGLLQPILVRPHNGQYQLIAGERRLKASKLAGLAAVPCRVLELEDRKVNEAALEENLKRSDLGALEKAQAFQDYIERFGCSIEDLGRQLSMNRATVSNFLRLLELPDVVKKALSTEAISFGHARAILSLDTEEARIELCKQVQREGLSVRKTEQAVRALQGKGEPDSDQPTIPFPSQKDGSANPDGMTNHVKSVEKQLQDLLEAHVKIQVGKNNAGKIIVAFKSTDEFEHILRKLRKGAGSGAGSAPSGAGSYRDAAR